MNRIGASWASKDRSTRSMSAANWLTLMAILALAAFLRFDGINWDSNQHLHPDERFIAMVAQERIGLPFPNLEDAHLLSPELSTMNPRSTDPSTGQAARFAYGSFPLYLLKLTDHVASIWWEPAKGFDGLTLLGRLLSALFDLGTGVLAFLIGRRLYGARTGLLAALLISLAVLHIQLAHFYAVDTVLTFFVTASIYLGLRVLERASLWRVTLLGCAAGLAISSKFSAVPLLLSCLLACLLSESDPDRRERGNRGPLPALALAGLALMTAGMVFLLFQPYVLLDPMAFVRDIQFESDMVRGVQILPYTIQYLGTEPVLYQLGTLFFWTAGPALVVAVLVGLLLFAGRLVRDLKPAEWVLAAWLVPYLGITLTFQVKFLRYLLPVFPLLVILAAMPLASSGAAGAESRRPHLRLGLAALLLVVAGTALQTVSFSSIYQTEHTRVQASRWVYSNVPPQATIATEHWDDQLPLPLVDNPRGYLDYYNITLPMYAPDTAHKKQELIRDLRRADYLILASNRLYGSIPKVPEMYPMASAYYALLFRGDLGFDQVAAFASYPGFGPFRIVDDTADESFTVYDHPKVLIFKKTTQRTEEELAALLPEPAESP